MRKVFIADAHLRNATDPNYRRLLSFLAEMQGNTETLFILGDLFEFWIGYRQVPFTQYYPVLDQLRQLVESGTELIYFEGNHDFHMGPFFKETLKAQIHRSAATLELDGKRVYLCHGDQINRGDIGYRVLRFLLHNSLSAALVPVIPVNLVTKVAERMGRTSRKGHQRHRLKWDYMAILREFAAARFNEGHDALITGHFHLPLLEKESSNGADRTLLSLGDWITHFSYGEWEDGQLTLKTYAGA
ncbi:MAG: UDP-2,3-diacylglucosamine diphosphatase [Geobacter sp.]|nr:MAG: UDP-2,3-diacylglucosamine diphosphatase [Geobacter sp.]